MQAFLIILLQCSVSMSPVTLAYMAMLPLLSRRYDAKWRYMVWLVIAAGWIFPFRPPIDLSFLPVQLPDTSVMPVQIMQPFSNTLPSAAATAGNFAGHSSMIPLWWVLAVIWIAGLVTVIAYHGLRHRHFMKMVNRWSEPVSDPRLLEILDGLKTELEIKTLARLNICQSVTSPMLVGFFRPAILLPPVKIADNELLLILKHELTHLKRRDLWYKALILTATVLHWFNPVVYLMAKASAVQCEISCDALVLQGADFQQRKQYGETIIGVVKNGAKLRTALSTNFYGGKKGMKYRISSIMDTKRKKAGVAVLCMVLVGIMMTGATLAAAADKEPANGYTAITEEAAYVQTPESKAKMYAGYEQYGLTYNKSTGQLFFNGELVRYFEDYYPVGDNEDGAYSGIDYFNENGTIDVQGVRDLSQLTLNPDGSTDPSGKLIGIEPYSQADFDARNIEELKNPPMQAMSVDDSSAADNSSTAQELPDDSLFSGYTYAVESGSKLTPDEYAKLYAVYEPFGLTYDKKQDCFYYNGKLVRQFIDILTSNGESLTSGKFKGSMRQINSPAGKGEVDVYTVRDYEKPDADGNGTLTGVRAYSQEEFDARTKDEYESDK